MTTRVTYKDRPCTYKICFARPGLASTIRKDSPFRQVDHPHWRVYSAGMTTPNFDYERELWDKGLEFVGGIDEVGRGAFAGPVVSAVVGFSSEVSIPTKVTIKDSKKITHTARVMADIWVKRNCAFYGIGSASVATINNSGITKATQIANRRAVIMAQNQLAQASSTHIINHLLSDAFYIPRIPGIPRAKQTPIIKGDNISISIAAASIIAKVYRDQHMAILHSVGVYSIYHWRRNKGYGTKAHREALVVHGPSIHHRTQYIQNYI